jgi:chromate transporter
MTHPSFRELFFTFGRIGLLSFGGPAGQIALMHRMLVEECQWLDEKQFLHALNFCMLLPGPEAMQLAVYAGWLKRGVGGGVLAGLLFILPGFAVILALSALCAAQGQAPLVAGLLFGLKAAVLGIVMQALLKVAKRALKGWESYLLAAAAFVAIALMKLPFPLVILAAALIGTVFAARFSLANADAPVAAPGVAHVRHLLAIASATAAFWLLPLGLMILLATGNIYAAQALYFSQTALVTFGGAYAVLAYVGQQAVEHYQWLTSGEMVTGLGLAETTPGPLILVLVFVGFLGAYRDPGAMSPLLAGSLGGFVTAWFTFLPSFLFVFLGAPYMERLRGIRWLAGALAAITAAVVGVIANLSVWFALHVLFARVGEVKAGPFSFWSPEFASLDWQAALIALVAGIALFRGIGFGQVLAGSALAGLALKMLA